MWRGRERSGVRGSGRGWERKFSPGTEGCTMPLPINQWPLCCISTQPKTERDQAKDQAKDQVPATNTHHTRHYTPLQPASVAL